MAIKLSTATVNAMADAATALVNNGGLAAGTITLYDGTQAADADSAVPAGNTALAVFTLSADAYGDAVNGKSDLNVPINADGDNAGTAAWFRLASNGTGGTTVFDGTVSDTNGTGDLKLNTTTISVGVNIEITAGDFTMPKS